MINVGPCTALYCLFGNPARHSLSPAMHNAGFQALQMDAVYLAFEPQSIEAGIAAMRALPICGASVTIPFKTDILALTDECTPMARSIGAANTIYRENDRLVADNTDGTGALLALKHAGTTVAGSNCLILGNGGSARAIAFTLLEAGARCTLAGRGSEAQQKLYRDLASRFSNKISNCLLTSLDQALCAEYDIIINTTPLGMRPDDPLPLSESLLLPKHTVFDIVYTAGQTPLLQRATDIGARPVRGIEMLFYQGIAQFERWTGQVAPQEPMREALEKGFAAKCATN